MVAVVKIIDEHFGRREKHSFNLHLASERITARELISRRVAEEVILVNERQNEAWREQERTRSFIVRFDASPVEAALNKKKQRPKPVQLDLDEEIQSAIEAFESNRFALLFDDRQIGDLDEEVAITPTSEIVFLRLSPLVGG